MALLLYMFINNYNNT